MNDYDVASLHIPYGPGWDARRIEKLIYQTVSSASSWSRIWTQSYSAGSWHEFDV
jgi:hypothetical protein